MSTAEGRCPIDGAPAPVSPRDPCALCPPCAARATDLAGRPVSVGNVSLSGGFAATHRDDASACEQVTEDHQVLVDGVPCRADEARFGGVVVQPVGAVQPRRDSSS